MIIFKSDLKLVGSCWHCKLTDPKIGRVTTPQYPDRSKISLVTMRRHYLPVELDTSQNRDPTRPADITVYVTAIWFYANSTLRDYCYLYHYRYLYLDVLPLQNYITLKFNNIIIIFILIKIFLFIIY